MLVALVGACDSSPDPIGPVMCGNTECDVDELCMTRTAGQVCDTNPDAGIGPFAVLEQYCVDMPAECHGAPTCECMLSRCSAGACYGDPANGQLSCGCY